jgi:hypothetical protein
MDGREYPDDLQLTGMYQWLGYSIGLWDGNVLVVETIGFNDKSWLDRSGHPHSTELRVTERIHRVDSETLVIDISIEDPKAYSQPWNGQMLFRSKNEWDLFEHICFSEASGSQEYFDYKERAWQATD